MSKGMSSIASNDVQAAGPDWEMAKAMVAKGLPIRQIVEECNLPSMDTLYKRIKRGQWGRLRTVPAKAVSSEVKAEPEGEAGVSDNSEKVRGLLGELIVRYTKALKRLTCPRSLRQIKEHMSVLAEISAASAPLFGWNTTGAMTLNFIGMSSAKELKDNLKTIDVPTCQIPQQISTEQRPTEPVVTGVPEQNKHALSGPVPPEPTGQPL